MKLKVQRERKKAKGVRIGYKKILIHKILWKWNVKEQKLEKMEVREEGREGAKN